MALGGKNPRMFNFKKLKNDKRVLFSSEPGRIDRCELEYPVDCNNGNSNVGVKNGNTYISETMPASAWKNSFKMSFYRNVKIYGTFLVRRNEMLFGRDTCVVPLY